MYLARFNAEGEPDKPNDRLIISEVLVSPQKKGRFSTASCSAKAHSTDARGIVQKHFPELAAQSDKPHVTTGENFIALAVGNKSKIFANWRGCEAVVLGGIDTSRLGETQRQDLVRFLTDNVFTAPAACLSSDDDKDYSPLYPDAPALIASKKLGEILDACVGRFQLQSPHQQKPGRQRREDEGHTATAAR